MLHRASIAIVVAAALSSCAAPTNQTDASMVAYDKYTEYAVTPRTHGFTLAINYSRYQFIPESDAVASCPALPRFGRDGLDESPRSAVAASAM